jgi:hypothetical protein
MKAIFICVLMIGLSLPSFAANLTATVSSSTGWGGKKGKINLTISGGYAPYTILWTGPGGYSSSKLNPDSLAAGTYCVSVTDDYCGVAKLCVTVTEQISSISELTESKTKVFPNPFKNEIFIELNNQNVGEAVQLILYNQLGKVVAQKQTVAQKQISWNLDSELAAGIYILSIKTESGLQILHQICSVAR